MRNKTIGRFIVFLLTAAVSAGFISSQGSLIRPVLLERPIPDFSLPVLQGGQWSISQLKGKNILLIFPRGLVEPERWCQICHYQYLDLADLEKRLGLRKKFNLEIAFVLPYVKEKAADWAAKFPQQMEVIEEWKNPPHGEALTERRKRWAEFAKKYFPKKFEFGEGKVPLIFPILYDEERTVSKGLGIFTTEWNNSKVDQNIPLILLVNESGMVRFKYLSQNTFDRPSFEFLIRFMERMLAD